MRLKPTLIVFLSAMICCMDGRTAEAQQDVDDPRLETLVSISYQDAAATDVLFALGRAGNLRTNMTTRPLLPVTVTLTNVKLRTALDAVCQNAGCYWHVERAAPQYGDILLMRIRALEEPLGPMPKTVSLAITQTSVAAALRAFAAAMNVRLILETDLPETLFNLKLENSDTAAALKLLCEVGNCSSELDVKNRTLRILPRK